MEGYVYIARIIDHGGKFVNGYHKIGLSKQYKVRETQLNSTHLPFDVLMVRVFETDNMNKLEGLLHLCFEDYRVVKEYDYRKNITTEWFDVCDVEVFNVRLDKFIDLMGIDEIDMNQTIDDDTTLTQEEKEQTKKNVENGGGIIRKEKLKLFWTQLLNEYKKVDSLFDTINPGKEMWLGKRFSGVGEFNFCVSGKSCSVELYINLFGTDEKEKNKMIYDKFYNYKSEIEQEFGESLEWARRDNGRGSRINLKTEGNVYDETQWEEMNNFLIEKMIKLSKVMTKYGKIV